MSLPKKLKTYLILALGLGFALSANTQQFVPDHYLSYRIISFSRPSNVFLKDQFISGKFNVGRPIKLLNPSDKLHLLPDGSINEVRRNNPRLHYVAHEVSWESPVPQTKKVRIVNQFEDSDITVVTYPDRLLAPAGKKQYSWQPPITDIGILPGTLGNAIAKSLAIILPIPQGNHYLCYRLDQEEVFTELAIFRDQFFLNDLKTLRRSHLCNPVIKRHNNKVYDTNIFAEDNHLVCYDIDETDISRKVLTHDQFGLRTTYVYLNDEVCVPSKKLEVTPEIPCGDVSADGQCPIATNCPDNTICLPADDGTPRCLCQ